MPAHAIGIRLIVRGKHQPDHLILLFEANRQLHGVCASPRNVGNRCFHRIQTVRRKTVDSWMRKHFKQACRILGFKRSQDKTFRFKFCHSNLLYFKIIISDHGMLKVVLAAPQVRQKALFAAAFR